jgi:GTP cyclohydrolase I
MDKTLMREGIELFLRGLYSDPDILNDPNFVDTPKRVANSYAELCCGINKIDLAKEILSTTFPCNNYDSIINYNGITVYSICPHHLLPVKYKVVIAYLPAENGKVIGASKPSRLVSLLAARPILQEDLTSEIADHLEKVLIPRGVAVVLKGEHDCMRVRGIKQPCSSMTTSEMRGVFKKSGKARSEFFELNRGAWND